MHLRAHARRRSWRLPLQLPMAAALLACARVCAGQPAVTHEPAAFYAEIRYTEPGSRRLAVHGRVEFAHTDSLDLERLAPHAARLPRLEAHLGANGMVLNPHLARPERYRTAAPRGTPTQWDYELDLARGDSLPSVVHPEFVCLWLGSVLLVPRAPAARGAAREEPGASALYLTFKLPAGWTALSPWSAGPGPARPADIDDMQDDFVALGRWHLESAALVPASACTLQVATAGTPGQPGVDWSAIVRRDVRMPEHGRFLACIAATSGVPRAFLARRSALLLWPAGAEPPREGEIQGLLRRPAAP